MEILKNLLDVDETIIWSRETNENLIPDQMKFEKDKKREMIIFITISIIIISFVILLVLLFESLIFLIFLTLIIGILRFFNARSNYKQAIQIYETLSSYHSNDVLRNYPILEVITNKHFIHFDLYDEDYPLWYGNDISQIYEFRNEFRFLNLGRLTDICKFIKRKRNRYDLGFYFDLPEYKLHGDDAPNYWLNNLFEQEYRDVLEVLSEFAPQAKISYLSKKQENLNA